MDYRVELDVFNGPMDLLLYLLKRDELDIYDIPIARITDSYMQYVNLLRGLKNEAGLDINVAGDFLVMAATLMEIKSAMLLPRQAPAAIESGARTAAQELTDPRLELVALDQVQQQVHRAVVDVELHAVVRLALVVGVAPVTFHVQLQG